MTGVCDASSTPGPSVLTRLSCRSMAISVDGLPRTTTICTGQHILIEGDDDDHPYVARVLRLFGDGERARLLDAVPGRAG